MVRTITFVTLLILTTARTLQAANILGLFPIKSRSHHMVFQSTLRGLSLRGHNVTVLTPFPLNDSKLTNLTEIETPSIDPNKYLAEICSVRVSKLKQAKECTNFFGIALENALRTAEMKAILSDENKATYDLILVQFNYPTLYALSERFKCPFVGIGNAPLFMGGYRALGNPEHPALQPKTFLDFRVHLSFFQRISSVFHSVWNDYHYHFNVLPRADSLMRNYLEKEEDLPYLGDIESKVSMVLSVGNFMTYATKANVPGLVDLENMHVRPNRSLPADLQEELDKAENGAVYFSLGSNRLLTVIPEQTQQILGQAMSELPYKFFWKSDAEEAPKLEENVIVRRWFPQQDLLSHPNVKLFITQGGLQSLEEAISRGVPLLGIPVFVDQHSNLHKMADLGVAKVFNNYETITSREFKAAVVEMMEDGRYLANMQTIRELMKDLPLTGVDKVTWWVEYVIRHKGAAHMRSPATNLHWYQYYMVDVVGFLILLSLGGVFIAYKLAKLILTIVKHSIKCLLFNS